MPTRRHLLLTSALLLGHAQAVLAAEIPFDQAAFDAAQTAGKPILVQISAPWCPICKAQKPVLEKLGRDPRFHDLALFDVDFDTQKALVRRFGARSQSTLIAYKGRTEVGRSVGETQPEWIESFLEKTL